MEWQTEIEYAAGSHSFSQEVANLIRGKTADIRKINIRKAGNSRVWVRITSIGGSDGPQAVIPGHGMK